MTLGENTTRIVVANNWVSQQDLPRLKARPLPAGTTVFAKIGEALKAERFRLLTRPTVVDNNMMGFEPHPGLDPAFGRYLLLVSRLPDVAAGSALPYLRAGDVAAIEVSVPSLVEQRAIAGVLSPLDDKIEANGRAVELAGGYMRLLTETMHQLPTTQLSSLATVSREVIDPLTLEVDAVEHYSIPAFDATGMPDVTLPSSIKSNKFAIRGPRVLVSLLNPRLPRIWHAVPRSATALGSTEFLVLEDQRSDSLAGVWLAVSGAPFMSQLQQHATGTSGSHQRIRPGDAMAVQVPDTRLADPAALLMTEDLLRMVHQLRVESRALGSLRSMLLPELMSGRLRVPEAEVVTEATA